MYTDQRIEYVQSTKIGITSFNQRKHTNKNKSQTK